MKTRMRFVKTGSVKFIGHLDCMRFFQKAIRRAKLDVAYSQGYSPHQLMSFASPLGVGITSDGEYLDVEFSSLPDISMAELTEYLNRFMTDEIFVTEIEIMPDGFKNSMSLLRAADYMIVEKEAGIFPEDYEIKWQEFISREEIAVLKKTKKSEKEVDIKPYILQNAFSMDTFAQKTGENYGKLHCQYEGSSIFLQLTSGSETNIKPELVMDAFFNHLGIECPPYALQVHRLQMYFNPVPEKKGGA
ncbi:MAG: TIGR03936 family radical SAM-associated protein [Eubacterium sp.]|nr:TIGR03936 family radical SAM-associated protein [Eubacterium sp.]